MAFGVPILTNCSARLTSLRVRIGRALVSTHEFHRAIEFYETAIKQAMQEGSRGGGAGVSSGRSSEAVSLSHDLARLYIKLDRRESAVRVLTRVLHEQFRDTTDMKQNVSTLLLLADIYKSTSPSEVLNVLRRAKDVQRDVLNSVSIILTIFFQLAPP